MTSLENGFTKYLSFGLNERVALVVTFGFLPETFGRWWRPTNGTLSFCEFRLGGGDIGNGGTQTPTLPTVTELVNFFALRSGGDSKALSSHPPVHARVPRSHLEKL